MGPRKAEVGGLAERLYAKFLSPISKWPSNHSKLTLGRLGGYTLKTLTQRDSGLRDPGMAQESETL